MTYASGIDDDVIGEFQFGVGQMIMSKASSYFLMPSVPGSSDSPPPPPGKACLHKKSAIQEVMQHINRKVFAIALIALTAMQPIAYAIGVAAEIRPCELEAFLSLIALRVALKCYRKGSGSYPDGTFPL